MRTTPRTPTAPSGGQTRQRALQSMLHDRQRDIQTVLRHRFGHAPGHGLNDGLDDTEHAEADVQEDIEVALIQMKAEILQRIREALVQLDAGHYGYCAECAGEISESRLRALPFAVRCTACQASHEQREIREGRWASLRRCRLSAADEIAS